MRKLAEPILITGGAGFVGANLARALVRKNYAVHLLVRRNTNMWRLDALAGRVQLHYGDLSNQQQIETMVNNIKPRTVFHLASFGNYAHQTDIDRMFATNIRGTFHLLQSLQSHAVRSFVHVGSSSEYGFKSRPMRESDILEPNSWYAVSKATATHIAQLFHQLHQVPVVILRPFSVYGPMEEDSRFVPTVIRHVLADQPIKLTAARTRRDFVYVDDVVAACLTAADRSIDTVGEIFNVGTGVQCSNAEIVNTVFQLLKRKVPVHRGKYPARMWDTDTWVADATKTKNYLDWQPQYNITHGLAATIAWFQKNSEQYEKSHT